MSTSRPRKTLRIAGIILLCLMLIGGGAALWLDGNYKRIIQKKLPRIAAKATDSLYHIDAGDVDIDLIGRRVVITDFELIPDAAHFARLRRELALPGLKLRIHIDRITMEDIDWSTVFTSREIVCGSMEVLHPVVRITRLPGSPDEDTADERKPSAIQAIRAGSILIQNPDLLYTSDTTKAATSFAAKGGDITLTDWAMDLRKPVDSTRLFFANNTLIRLASAAVLSPGGFYNISAGGVTYDQAAGSLSLGNLRVSPKLSKEAFYKRVNVQKEIYEVEAPRLALQGLDWKRLLHSGELVATRGALSDAAIRIYMSRIPPLNTESKNGKFPQQMLMKLKLPVSIPRLDISNGRFAYTEKNEKTMQEGTVAMSTINGAISNITNMPAGVRANNTMDISLKGVFKGSVIDARFRLRLDSRKGAFSITGALGPMPDGTALNDITRPLALAEIRSLRINGLQFSIDGDEAGAGGRMSFRYEDLKVALLEPEDGGLDKKDVSSFLANSLFIHSANPENRKELRNVTPYYKRDETKSFFNVVWKTLFTGTLQTASRKIIKLDKMVNEKQAKGEARRREAERGARKGAR